MDDRQKDALLLDALAEQSGMCVRDLKILRRHGPNYLPWKQLIEKFWEMNPDWTPQAQFRKNGQDALNREDREWREECHKDQVACGSCLFFFLFCAVAFLILFYSALATKY